jgi:hypothetical protein
MATLNRDLTEKLWKELKLEWVPLAEERRAKGLPTVPTAVLEAADEGVVVVRTFKRVHPVTMTVEHFKEPPVDLVVRPK